MDQHARHRSRGVRTIGRLATPPADDVLLAQWPLPADPEQQRQDVAVASGWTAAHSVRPTARSHLVDSDPISLCDAFHHHQLRVIDRLLEAIELELTAGESVVLVFEPPPMLQDDLLQTVRLAAAEGELSAEVARQLTQRTVIVGESVARLWALIELFRGNLIGKREIRSKRKAIEIELRSLPPLIP